MTRDTARSVWLSTTQAVLGGIGVVLLTYVCDRLGFDVAITAMLDLIAVVLLSLSGSFVASAVVSLTAALSLHFFFVEPRNRWGFEDPLDIVALAAFLTTALVITRLLSRVRASLQEARAARNDLRLAIDTIPALVWTTLPDGSSEFNNERWLEYTGLSREEAREWGYRAALHPEDYERLLPKWTASFKTGQVIEDEARLRRADGEYRWFLHRAVPLRDARGNIIKWYGTSFDIEERNRAKELLRERARLLDLTHDTVFVRDVNDVITYWNRGAEQLYGWTSEEAVGKVSHELTQTIFPVPLEEITATLLRTGRWEGELVHAKRDGTRVIVASRWSLQRDHQGNPAGVLETNNDITERKRAEEVLREQARLLDLTHDSIFVRDLNNVITYWNWGAEELYGWTREEAVGKVAHQLLETVFPAPLDEITATLLSTDRWEGELVHTTRDGRRVVVSSRWSLQRDENGQPLGTLETNNDITRRKQVENALRRSETYLAEAQRMSQTGSLGWDVATGELVWSDETFRIFEYDRANTRPTVELALQRVHPEDLAVVREQIERATREGKDWILDHRLLMPDGSVKHVHVVARPTWDTPDKLEFVGAVMDVTERKRAERALRRTRERALKARFAAVLDERTRLAREIHDTLLQGFTGISLKLVAATSRLTDPPETVAALRDVISLAQKTLVDARRAVWDLRTPSLEGGDFAAALRAAAEDCVRGTGLTLEYAVVGVPRPLEPDIEGAALRVVQEAVTNVVKHAAAGTVRVRLSFRARWVRVAVMDDGRGFTVEPDFRAYGGHWGLLGMRERATQVGGKLRVRSTPGQATDVVLLVPYVIRRGLRPRSAVTQTP
jgi:PAS domain S-box-containing protein